MYGYVYKTTDLATNKIYVGQHKASQFDSSYFGSGIKITRIIQKYGKERFKNELLEECEDANHLNEREIFWINKLDSTNDTIGYNIATGGSFGDSGYHQGMLGKSQSDFQKQQARIANSKPKSEQMKRKMSKALLGNTNARQGKGMKFIHMGTQQKRVKEELIPEYEAKGWVRGKSQEVIEAQRKAYKEKYANGTYINNSIDSKFVANSELQQWLSQGWKVGKGPKNYKNRKSK